LGSLGERAIRKNSGKNDVKPIFRKSKSLYYKGFEIIEFQRVSFASGYEITLDTDKTMHITNEEWLKNFYASD
jgi:hypothetical protein